MTLRLLQQVLIEAAASKIKKSEVEFASEKLEELRNRLIGQDYDIIKKELEDLGAEPSKLAKAEEASVAGTGQS